MLYSSFKILAAPFFCFLFFAANAVTAPDNKAQGKGAQKLITKLEAAFPTSPSLTDVKKLCSEKDAGTCAKRLVDVTEELLRGALFSRVFQSLSKNSLDAYLQADQVLADLGTSAEATGTFSGFETILDNLSQMDSADSVEKGLSKLSQRAPSAHLEESGAPPACKASYSTKKLSKALSTLARKAGLKSSALVNSLRSAIPKGKLAWDLNAPASSKESLWLFLLTTPPGISMLSEGLSASEGKGIELIPATSGQTAQIFSSGPAITAMDNIFTKSTLKNGRPMVVYFSVLPLAVQAPLLVHALSHALDESNRIPADPGPDDSKSLSYSEERHALDLENTWIRTQGDDLECVEEALDFYAARGLYRVLPSDDIYIAAAMGMDLDTLSQFRSGKKERTTAGKYEESIFPPEEPLVPQCVESAPPYYCR